MFPNTKFLEQHKFATEDFARLCKMSSWAICGRRSSSADTNSDDDHARNAVQEEEDKDETT